MTVKNDISEADGNSTAAAQTIDNKPVYSRAELMSMAAAQLSAMKPDDLTDFFWKSLQPPPTVGNNADSNKNSLNMKPSGASPGQPPFPVVKEDVAALFEGAEVSEDFVARAVVLIESTVAGRVAVERAAIEEAAETVAAEEIA